MKWNICILIITAMLCLTFTGLASATNGAVDVKCIWEPCGEKVDQGEIDAVYALIPANEMRIVYTDTDSDGNCGVGDTLYIDTIPGFDEIAVGDVRLTDSCGTYDPNTKVAHGDKDVGLSTKILPGGQVVVGFIDVNNNDVYDLKDWLYIDTDDSGAVSVNDIRLYSGSEFDPYSRVKASDGDPYLGDSLLDLRTYDDELVISINELLGYIDSDCSGDWTCVDKLYLQQPFNYEAGESFADYVVTIGDFRLFIPQAAIDNEGWPECGTKVEQGDIDAVYALTLDWSMKIMYADSNGNNVFDELEGLYIDTVVAYENGYEVAAGDVRLVLTGNSNGEPYEPNTKVVHGDGDHDARLKQLPEYPGSDTPGGTQEVIGFVDVSNNGVYDIEDPLFVDTDNSDSVSIRDVRLTPVNGVEAYSRVDSNDPVFGFPLLDIAIPSQSPSTPIGRMLGYIDSDCSNDWTCPDKLYLQQIFSVETTGETFSDFFVSIGDFRLYIPPEAIANESWPDCGTKVEQCDIDAVYTLIFYTEMRIMYADGNSNNRFDDDEGLYIDAVHDLNEVEVGDVRLTDYCGTYEPNTKVNHSDNDLGHTLKYLPTVGPSVPAGPPGQNVVGYVDIANDKVYSIEDPVYVDTDASGTVTVRDVRLTEVNGYPAYSRVAIGDKDIGGVLKDLVTNYAPLETPIWYLLGYIDSDCSGDWTCTDKLYLQQFVIDGPMHNFVVTIGDLRIYIPPEEIADNSGTLVEVFDPMMYDANSNQMIEKDEVFAAIMDYFAEPALLTKEEVLEVIMVYFSSP